MCNLRIVLVNIEILLMKTILAELLLLILIDNINASLFENSRWLETVETNTNNN